MICKRSEFPYWFFYSDFSPPFFSNRDYNYIGISANADEEPETQPEDDNDNPGDSSTTGDTSAHVEKPFDLELEQLLTSLGIPYMHP
jgi:hypothetical protein